MHRLITEHALRKVCEPSPLWQLTAPVRALALVPGTWAAIPALAEHRGPVTLEKTVTCGGTLRFVLGGASGQMTAWLDDRLLGDATPGQPLSALAEDVPFASHCLRVTVQPGEAPGFLRPVTIEQLGSALMTSLQVTPRRKGRLWLAELTVRVRSLSDAPQTFDLEATVGPAAARWKRRLLPPRAEVTLSALAPAPGVASWSPDVPRLVPAESVLWLEGEPADDLRDRMGFCEKASRGDAFLLNGKPLALRPYRPERCAWTPEDMLAQVHSALSEGASLLCPAGFADARLLDLCDQAGLLALADAPGMHPCCVRPAEFPQGGAFHG